jgi:hypothetical protein
METDVNPIRTYQPSLLVPEALEFEYLRKDEPMLTSIQKINKNFRLIQVLYNSKSKLLNIIISLCLINFALGICLLFAILAILSV